MPIFAPKRYARNMELEPDSPEQLDVSEDMDLVTVFNSETHTSQMEAQFVRGILETGGITAVIVGNTALPQLPFEVRVPKAQLEDALRLIAESEAAGPRGAEEAEQASEGSVAPPED
jgi:hypothetical protein